MPPRRRVAPARDDSARRAVSPRSKRAEILEVATAYFGEHGFEDTKWADVAAAVGIGSTALYHYFESKLHCLYVILAEALESFKNDFDRITGEHENFRDALLALLESSFDLTDQQVLRNRLLVAELGLVGIHRVSPREEEARALARSRIRDLEFAWGTFLTRGMQQGIIPEANPRLVTRAVLGLYNSVWHWYRPRGDMSLDAVAEFFIERQLAVLGVSPESELLDGRKSSAGRAKVAAKRARPRPAPVASPRAKSTG
jgi:TetR/AcrR family transcriptional regulator, cholesterol catabolism regulator